ncbi:40S ribosomal protein S15 [Choanephora cucurbitarum]|uniref:40S ribosomal protein S15 n=3 Tax=Choanephora cucurbitarum TaxID=101091 RepID=A0A1C7NG03_9FUNG|nr:40S ribosomal protein S15 [Choanephora cucurbitarum]
MADEQTPRKRTFRKFTYRGIDLEQLLDLSSEQFMDLVHCRARRRFQRGLKRKPMGLIKKLRAAKKNAPSGEKPEVVKTHLRNMIIVPEMIGSVIGIYNGKTFNQVEIKPEMTGHYLGEFSITYKPVKHGRPGIGATHSSKLRITILYNTLYRKQATLHLTQTGQNYMHSSFSVGAWCQHSDALSADEQTPRKRTFRKFTYRGIDLEQLLDLSSEQFMDLVHCRARRRFQRGLKRKPMGLIKKLRAAKKNAPSGEKPEVVKTHLRNMIIVPEMIGSVIGIYNGKTFNQVEIKPEMTGHYLGEFSITYKPVKHGRPGIGATHSSKFVPLK